MGWVGGLTNLRTAVANRQRGEVQTKKIRTNFHVPPMKVALWVTALSEGVKNLEKTQNAWVPCENGNGRSGQKTK